ncbi:MAG: MSCRAMM family protein [Candidatus Acidiferrales bacterium]
MQITVERAFKGIGPGPVEIATGMGGGDCGYGFRVGERYLVYAHRDAKTGQIVTGICTRTQPLSRADADLAFLSSLARPQSSGRIFGQVTRHVFDMREGRDGERTGIPGVAVMAAGPTRRFRAVTDNGGEYVFPGLPPGAYWVTAELRPELTAGDEPRRAQLFAGGCARVDFFARPDGEISGTVYGPDGNPVSNLHLELVPEDLADSGPVGKTLSAYSDAGGSYVFQTVPPGQYVLGIHISQPPSTDITRAPYPRTFFPGVLDVRDAIPIKLAEGEKRLHQDLRIPMQLQERVLQGVVEWPDGTPAVGASVQMEDVEYPFRQVTYASSVDAQGRFTLSGFAGYTYVVSLGSLRMLADPRSRCMLNRWKSHRMQSR